MDARTHQAQTQNGHCKTWLACQGEVKLKGATWESYQAGGAEDSGEAGRSRGGRRRLLRTLEKRDFEEPRSPSWLQYHIGFQADNMY
jgi:hypothetical protein